MEVIRRESGDGSQACEGQRFAKVLLDVDENWEHAIKLRAGRLPISTFLAKCDDPKARPDLSHSADPKSVLSPDAQCSRPRPAWVRDDTADRDPDIQHPRAARARATWLLPVGFILLSLVPVIAGAMRLSELTLGAEITEDNARFFANPVPVILHIVGASVYSLLGAFQFVPRLRRGRPSWHRIAGRILVPAGIIAGLSGMWLAIAYPRPGADVVVRLVFATLMVGSILLGLRAILRRDVPTHRAWMIRGYAIGMGAGTQLFVFLTYGLIAGEPDETITIVLMVAGWVINLAVAEIAIRRRSIA